ncbi:M16 family metallopeptidase [Streptomyces sp. NPDC050355]|uniref:M16 family metallopeptidase n=1 Tax=Streptomyces sp. NPDC050355 TaxID=3365609 RepID=UPI0037AB611E
MKLPALHKSPTPVRPEITHTVADNGLDVYLVRDSRAPLAEVRLMIPCSGTNRLHAGQAELLVHDLRERLARRERLTGQPTAWDVSWTGEWLRISGHLPSTDLRRGLVPLADLLTPADATDTDLATWAVPVAKRARSRLLDHGEIVSRALRQRSFLPDGLPETLPDPEAVGLITAAEYHDFHDLVMRSAGAFLVVVGDVALSHVLEHLPRSFQTHALAMRLTATPAPQGGLHTLPTFPTGTQGEATLQLCAPAGPADSRSTAHDLLNVLFGAYSGARLVTHAQRLPRAPSLYSTLNATAGQRQFIVTARLHPDDITTGIRFINSEMDRMLTQALSVEESTAAKNFCLGQITSVLDSPADLASKISLDLSLGREPDWCFDFPEALRKVTPLDLGAASEELFAHQGWTAAVCGELKEDPVGNEWTRLRR